MTPPLPAIPADINDLDRLAAARFYTDTLGWAVHPLNGPNKGSEKERGKKPLMSGWPQHRVVTATEPRLHRKRLTGPSTLRMLSRVGWEA